MNLFVFKYLVNLFFFKKKVLVLSGVGNTQPVIWVWLVTSFLTANSYAIFSSTLLIGNTKVLMRLTNVILKGVMGPQQGKASPAVLSLAGGFSLFELYS